MTTNDLNRLSQEIISAAIEVHNILGPGLLEPTYNKALTHELRLRGFNVDSEVEIPCIYKGVRLNTAYRADIIVENAVIIELKATDNDNPVFKKQLMTYLRLADKRLGLLINFNKPRVMDGLTRLVNELDE